MGQQPLQDDEDWDFPADEEMLKDLSPLPEARQHVLFQRLARHREAYFADVEMLPEGSEEQERVAPSGFADLSTWCCDAFPLARERSFSAPDRFSGRAALADQPTIPLSSLASPQVQHIADIPTVPNLTAWSASSADEPGLCVRTRPPLNTCLREIWTRLWQFCLRLWHARSKRIAARVSTFDGHALLMQRVREREQSRTSPRFLAPSSPTHQVRLPADRLGR